MLIQNVRLSFPHLFTADSFSPGQEAKYSGTFILEPNHPQLAEIKDHITEIVKGKWPKGMPSSLKVCLRPNSEKEMDGFDEGGFFFNASNKTRPTVVDSNRSPLAEQDGKPYAGCYVNVLIDFWAQDNNYGKRVNASLSGVQFVRDGDAFGGGRPASANDFPELEPVASDEAPWAPEPSAAHPAPKVAPQTNVAENLFG